MDLLITLLTLLSLLSEHLNIRPILEIISLAKYLNLLCLIKCRCLQHLVDLILQLGIKRPELFKQSLNVHQLANDRVVLDLSSFELQQQVVSKETAVGQHQVILHLEVRHAVLCL